ncbi:hypothetical protein C9374_014352 [Naegleria lovaniensis]|uniref:Uncharacterized protein n=1 Tax=Naegleria lovaniensis TaxID=51637 RepID=A0AA88GXN0_NAELO|nr:uncharacterized protein C9374_014352 [Naegleria lovaniensis]KAG2388952.1 hypothetical protein C9374_014352 [Naegleria lovaniensis]
MTAHSQQSERHENPRMRNNLICEQECHQQTSSQSSQQQQPPLYCCQILSTLQDFKYSSTHVRPSTIHLKFSNRMMTSDTHEGHCSGVSNHALQTSPQKIPIRLPSSPASKRIISSQQLNLAFPILNPKISTLQNAFQHVPNPTPVTLSSSLIQSLKSFSTSNSSNSFNSSKLKNFKFPSLLAQPSTNHSFQIGFQLTHPLPWKGSNGGFCCVICSMLAQKIIFGPPQDFSQHWKRKKGHLENGIITNEILKKIIQMYGEGFSNLLGGRMCDRHVSQICGKQVELVNSVSTMPTVNESTTMHSSMISLKKREDNHHSNSLESNRKTRKITPTEATTNSNDEQEDNFDFDASSQSSDYSSMDDDDGSSEDFENHSNSESSPNRFQTSQRKSNPLLESPRISTRRQQKQELLCNYKRLIEKEKLTDEEEEEEEPFPNQTLSIKEKEEEKQTVKKSSESSSNGQTHPLLTLTTTTNTSPRPRRRFFRRGTDHVSSSRSVTTIHQRRDLPLDQDAISIVIVNSNDHSASSMNVMNTNHGHACCGDDSSSTSNHSMDQLKPNSPSKKSSTTISNSHHERMYLDFLEYDDQDDVESNSHEGDDHTTSLEEPILNPSVHDFPNLKVLDNTRSMSQQPQTFDTSCKNEDSFHVLVSLMEELVNQEDEQAHGSCVVQLGENHETLNSVPPRRRFIRRFVK